MCVFQGAGEIFSIRRARQQEVDVTLLLSVRHLKKLIFFLYHSFKIEVNIEM